MRRSFVNLYLFILIFTPLPGMGDKPKVVILCGGMGTRLRDYADPVPKALVRIGEMPIIWHVMKTYAHYGYTDFVLCLGFKGDSIRRYFLDFEHMTNDFTLNLRSREQRVISHGQVEDWRITFAETGLHSKTARRIKLIEKYIDTEHFFCTYTDGLSTVDIPQLYDFHTRTGKVATLTAVNPASPFGVVTEEGGLVTSFREKPQLAGLTNGGFFCFSRKVFSYLEGDVFLEQEPLTRLANEGQLAAFRHEGFWMPMDTFKDVERLNKMYDEQNVPWMVWRNAP